ncbi:MAG: protein kinase [Chlamydiales bacterium]|nr:protein kinase [Chlamydiales bacterium]
MSLDSDFDRFREGISVSPTKGGKEELYLTRSDLENRVNGIAVRSLSPSSSEEGSSSSEGGRSTPEKKGLFKRLSNLLSPYLPVTLDTPEGHRLEVKVKDVAKRLDITKEKATELIKSGAFNRFLDFTFHEALHHKDINLPASTLAEICTYVTANRERMILEAKNNPNGLVYARAQENEPPPRGIQFNADGSVFIHLNKKSQDDPTVGRGDEKVVRYALNFDTGELLAVSRLKAGIDPSSIDREARFLEQFKGKRGIAQAIQCAEVQGKEGIDKKFFIQPYYNAGDLEALLTSSDLSQKDVLMVVVDLLEGLKALEEANISHRDIHFGNVFLHRDLEGNLHAYIADFGNAVELSDEHQIQAIKQRALEEGKIPEKPSLLSNLVQVGALLRPFSVKLGSPVHPDVPLSSDITENPLEHLAHELMSIGNAATPEQQAELPSAASIAAKYIPLLEDKLRASSPESSIQFSPRSSGGSTSGSPSESPTEFL